MRTSFFACALLLLAQSAEASQASACVEGNRDPAATSMVADNDSKEVDASLSDRLHDITEGSATITIDELRSAHQ